MKPIRSMMAVTLFAAVAAGCSDTSGPGTGDVRVYMNKSAVSATETASAGMAASMLGTIPLTAVDSINVVLTSIEAVNVNDSSGGVTIALQGAGTSSLNLMKLASFSDSTLLARGTLAAGTYNNIRLRFSSATIYLNQQVTVGQSTYPAGVYDLTVPSGLSSGIKVQGTSFTVADDASTSVTLTFDPTSTVGTIVATGSNKLMMSPVIHVRTNVEDDD